MSRSAQLNLYVDVDVLTAGSLAEVVNAIFESLLFQRNQIPFVYKTYRYYVNKWLEDGEKQDNMDTIPGLRNFQGQRQKDSAKKTKLLISAMKEAIKETFERKRVKCVRFLFGATTFTPKEAYTIHIPTESMLTNHCHEHHRISQTKLNQTLLSLLTSEDLYTIFSNNLNPTNVYLELEVLEHPSAVTSSSASYVESLAKCQMFPKDFVALPPSCKQIHLNLVHKRNANFDEKHLICCKELRIFEDIMTLNFESDANLRDGAAKDKTTITSTESNIGWWESEIVVRGFKEEKLKGFTLWS